MVRIETKEELENGNFERFIVVCPADFIFPQKYFKYLGYQITEISSSRNKKYYNVHIDRVSLKVTINAFGSLPNKDNNLCATTSNVLMDYISDDEAYYNQSKKDIIDSFSYFNDAMKKLQSSVKKIGEVKIPDIDVSKLY